MGISLGVATASATQQVVTSDAELQATELMKTCLVSILLAVHMPPIWEKICHTAQFPKSSEGCSRAGGLVKGGIAGRQKTQGPGNLGSWETEA